MENSKKCPECDEIISPISKMGPHISGHRRTQNAKYRYFNGDNKHPYELKSCEGCKKEDWIQTRQKFCSTRCSKMGELNPRWKGDEAKPSSARYRAHALFEVFGKCSRCNEKEAKHRHHKDENTYNNILENIELLCASCHGREHMTGNTYTVGSKHPKAKLIEEQIVEIRQKCIDGMAHSQIAIQYGVSASTISNVKARRIWKHVL